MVLTCLVELISWIPLKNLYQYIFILFLSRPPAFSSLPCAMDQTYDICSPPDSEPQRSSFNVDTHMLHPFDRRDSRCSRGTILLSSLTKFIPDIHYVDNHGMVKIDVVPQRKTESAQRTAMHLAVVAVFLFFTCRFAEYDREKKKKNRVSTHLIIFLTGNQRSRLWAERLGRRDFIIWVYESVESSSLVKVVGRTFVRGLRSKKALHALSRWQPRLNEDVETITQSRRMRRWMIFSSVNSSQRTATDKF